MSSSDRFLTWQPWAGGINNTRMNFETIATLAMLTDRTLVCPDALYREPHEAALNMPHFRPLHPKSFLDLARLPQMLRAADIDLGDPSDVHSDAETLRCPGSEHRLADQFILCVDRHLDPDHVLQFAAGRRIFSLSEREQACRVLHVPQLLEHFYAWICGREATMARARDYVRTTLRHPAACEQIAQRIAESISPFYAAVVRRAEFVRAYQQADIPASVIGGALLRRVPRQATLLVATDEADRAWFSSWQPLWRVVFARDLVRDCGLPEHQLGCVEQELCALAATFVGTCLSTFSGFVNRLRGYSGQPDQGSHFTDPAMPDSASDPPTGFSWAAWRAAGRPLWARQFPEGWRASPVAPAMDLRAA